MNVSGHGVNKMSITYTWDCEINKTQPYNINSSQANIIEQITWSFIGDNGENKAGISGVVGYDVTQGVAGSFVAIEDVSKSTLEEWVKATVGNERITEMENEIKNTLDVLVDNNPVPEDSGEGTSYPSDTEIM